MIRLIDSEIRDIYLSDENESVQFNENYFPEILWKNLFITMYLKWYDRSLVILSPI